MISQLALLPADDRSRAGRDRLELLSALIAAPGFDPLYRPDLIEMPPDHPVYGWRCQVPECRCVARGPGLCTGHARQWRAIGRDEVKRADFIAGSAPIPKPGGRGAGSCRICPEQPASNKGARLCSRHCHRWRRHRAAAPEVDFERWVTAQSPFPGHGTCQVTVCPCLATSAAGLCLGHQIRYRKDGKPGNVRLTSHWPAGPGGKGVPASAAVDDKGAFLRWRSAAEPIYQDGIVNLTGLQPLVKAEIQWGMHAHAQLRSPPRWDCSALQHLAIVCRAGRVTSLFDLAEGRPGQAGGLPGHNDSRVRMIVFGIVESLWCVYYSPDDSREAGFIETGHFGRRFPDSRSHYDLTAVSQRWLRDMLWDHLAGLLRSPRCPRSRGPFDSYRRAAAELSAFLEADAPEGGHDPALLREDHAQRFVADQRHRERHRLPFGGSPGRTGSRPWSPKAPAGPCSTHCTPLPTGRWSPERLKPLA